MSDMTEYPRLNRKQHPVDHRYLLRDSWVRDDLYEGIVREWSPNGNVKIEWKNGATVWLSPKADTLPEVVEDLGSIHRVEIKKRA